MRQFEMHPMKNILCVIQKKHVYLQREYFKFMGILNITISDVEYGRFGISNEQLSFTDFIGIISRELMRQNLNHSVALAEKYGLSSMTMEEITNEVKAVRQNAKAYY